MAGKEEHAKPTADEHNDDDDGDSSSSSPVVLTPRDAILNSADLLNETPVTVCGRVVLADAERGRMDLVHGGAKLIVRLPDGGGAPAAAAAVATGNLARATGVLRKEQRRTFLQATSVRILCPPERKDGGS